jgi:urease accessory protein
MNPRADENHPEGRAPARSPSSSASPSPDFAYLPFLLQTADALFPTGAYAHSLGFEEIVRLGLVKNEATLGTFLQQQIIPAQQQHELPYLRFAFEAADDSIVHLCAIDQEISAWKVARETREASAQLGGRRLRALRTISDATQFTEFEEAIQQGHAAGHHLAVCGLQARLEAIPLHAALTTYFYQSLAAICAAAMKLIRIGQDGCQRVLRAACLHAESAIYCSLTIPRENAGWFNPLLEIAAMRHERANERLFIS